MNYNKIHEIIQIFSDNDNFLILIHDNPDGDALGSSTALALFLKKIGKKCAVLSPSAIPKHLTFAKSSEVRYIELTDSDSHIEFDYEYIVSVDVATPELLGNAKASFADKINLAIDHHLTTTIASEHKYTDSTAAATGEILYSVFSMYAMVLQSNVFDKALSEALYTAISSDTGCFKYGNTTSLTHEIASNLLSVGIDAERINRLLFDTKTILQIEVEKLAYSKMNFYFNNRVAVVTITKVELKKIGASEEDTGAIAQIPRMVSGVQISAMMREKTYPDGKTGYKFSVRANIDTDLNALCASFGGGGHKKAAGCTIFEDEDTALQLFLKEAEKYLV